MPREAFDMHASPFLDWRNRHIIERWYDGRWCCQIDLRIVICPLYNGSYLAINEGGSDLVPNHSSLLENRNGGVTDLYRNCYVSFAPCLIRSSSTNVASTIGTTSNTLHHLFLLLLGLYHFSTLTCILGLTTYTNQIIRTTNLPRY